MNNESVDWVGKMSPGVFGIIHHKIALVLLLVLLMCCIPLSSVPTAKQHGEGVSKDVKRHQKNAGQTVEYLVINIALIPLYGFPVTSDFSQCSRRICWQKS